MRARTNGHKPQGRRIRDLYRGYHAAMGCPSDPTIQAAILAAAELMVAAETARAAFLQGSGDIEQIVRLENLAQRAVRRLGIKPGVAPKPPSLAEYLASLAPQPAIAPSPSGAAEQPAAEAHQRPPGDDGEASDEASD